MQTIHSVDQFIQEIEKPTPPYKGSGEMILALVVLPLAFIYKLLDCLYGKQPIPGHPWPYILLLSTFTAIAFSSVLFLATPAGARWIRRLLLENQLTKLAALPVLYVGSFLLLLWTLGLPQLYTHTLVMITAPWSQLPTPIFLFLAGVLLFTGFRSGLSLALQYAANQSAPRFFGLRQLGCVCLAVLPFLILQEQLPLVWCFTTPVAVIVMVYGTGLGREYFGYSFVPRSMKEALWIILLLLCGLSLFLLTTLGAGTITYTGGLWKSTRIILYDSVFVWLFIVGISEEVIFRCGILILVSGLLEKKTGSWWGQHPRLSAVLITSALFALAHLFRGATLFFLSFLASLLYGLAFVTGKSLFGPVLLHGLLNVLVLMNFYLADFH